MFEELSTKRSSTWGDIVGLPPDAGLNLLTPYQSGNRTSKLEDAVIYPRQYIELAYAQQDVTTRMRL
jgi:hypothetical protein